MKSVELEGNSGSQINNDMSESGEGSGPPIQQESACESEDDSDEDFDPEEIEKEILGVRSMLRRHCGHHKVLRKSN